MHNYFDERVVIAEEEREYHEKNQLPERIPGVQYYCGYIRQYYMRPGALVLCHVENGEIIYDVCDKLPRYTPVEFVKHIEKYYQPKMLFVQ